MKVRQVADENIVILPDANSTDLTRVVGLNESALLLYEGLQGRDFELKDVVQLLTSEYEVSEEQATKDALAWVDAMKKNGLVD
jgi:hypothetical protein